MSPESTQTVGTQGQLGHYVHAKINVALSCLNFVKQSFIREKGQGISVAA